MKQATNFNTQKQIRFNTYQFKPDTFKRARARVDELEHDRGFKETKQYLENRLNRLTGAERMVTMHAYRYLLGTAA